MHMMKRHHWLGLVALIGSLLLGPVVHADPRLALFLEKYEELEGRTPPLAHADSPFYPYHTRLFETGLDDKKLSALRSAQRKGDCVKVEYLLLEGFLGLFPFLKPAFEGERRANLMFMIAKDGRPEHGRCEDHSKIQEALTLKPLAELPPVDFAETDYARSNDLLDPKTPRAAIQGFGERAFCDDYPPSIDDLRAIVNRPGGIVLTVQEEVYLLERARIYGLGKAEYAKTYTRLKKELDPDTNLSRLRDVSRRNKIAGIGFKVDGYWQSYCRYVENYRQRKLMQ